VSIAVIGSMLAICFLVPEAHAQSYSVSGYVRDAVTNVAVPNAYVRLRYYDTTSGLYAQNNYSADSNGYFTAGWSTCPNCNGGNLELYACRDVRAGIVSYIGSGTSETKNILISTQGGSPVLINEWASNNPGTDEWEFVELVGVPFTLLDNLSIVLIEGEGSGKGVVDRIIDLTGYTIPDDGYFVIGDANVNPDLQMPINFIENGGNNILLVEGVSVTVNQDIDVDDDGIEDMPIGLAVFDGVGYGTPTGPDPDAITYCGAWPVGPDYQYDPAAGARCSIFWCTQVPIWATLCMAGTIPGGVCDFAGYDVEFATPGAPNACSAGPVSVGEAGLELSTWGRIKATYR